MEMRCDFYVEFALFQFCILSYFGLFFDLFKVHVSEIYHSPNSVLVVVLVLVVTLL